MKLFSGISAALAPDRHGEDTTSFERFALQSLGATRFWTPRAEDAIEGPLRERFVDLCLRAGVPTPKVYVYESPTPNAACLSNGTVVIDRRFLEKMTPARVDAVLGHEMTHHQRRGFTFFVGEGLSLGFLYLFHKACDRVAGPWLGAKDWFKNSSVARVACVLVQVFAAIKTLPYAMGWFWRREERIADKGGAALTSPKDMREALETLEDIYKPIVAAREASKPGWYRELENFPSKSLRQGIRKVLGGIKADHPPTPERRRDLAKMEGVPLSPMKEASHVETHERALMASFVDGFAR